MHQLMVQPLDQGRSAHSQPRGQQKQLGHQRPGTSDMQIPETGRVDSHDKCGIIVSAQVQLLLQQLWTSAWIQMPFAVRLALRRANLENPNLRLLECAPLKLGRKHLQPKHDVFSLSVSQTNPRPATPDPHGIQRVYATVRHIGTCLGLQQQLVQLRPRLRSLCVENLPRRGSSDLLEFSVGTPPR